jgi:hypothetical protein
MNCSWCSYHTEKVKPGFTGYCIFNSFGEAMYYRFCSINCCVAMIYALETQSELRLDMLYRHYNLKNFVSPAKSRTQLKDFGGKLTYEEYRKDFTIPDTENESKPKNTAFVYSSYDTGIKQEISSYDEDEEGNYEYQVNNYEEDECDGW